MGTAGNIHVLAQPASIPVVILGKPDKASHGEVFIREWSPQQRLMRSLKTLLIWLMIMAVSAVVPVLHFILVPLFFLAALVFSFMAFAQTSVVLGGKGTCPFCGEPFAIAKRANRWPLDDICAKCSRHVSIQKSE